MLKLRGESSARMHTLVSTSLASVLPAGAFPVPLTQALPRPILRVWRGWGSGQARSQIFRREGTKLWVWKREDSGAHASRRRCPPRRVTGGGAEVAAELTHAHWLLVPILRKWVGCPATGPAPPRPLIPAPYSLRWRRLAAGVAVVLVLGAGTCTFLGQAAGLWSPAYEGPLRISARS